MGYDTSTFSPEQISIELLGETDTLEIDGLIQSLRRNSTFRQIVKGVVVNDTINIIYEESTPNNNDLIRGKIWIIGDSIIMDYLWDTMDTYNWLIPERGMVTARGLKIR